MMLTVKIVLLFFSFGVLVDALPPQVLSATYQIKEARLEAVQETHAVITVNTDQEVYFLDDPVCGCKTRQQRPCSVYSGAPVNETGFNIVTLAKGDWYDVPWSAHETTLYFKFFLDDCSILRIEHNQNFGDSAMAVSNRFIPNPTRFQHIKYRWARDSLWICPQSQEFVSGWWYLSVTPENPRVAHVSYRLRWSTKEQETCPPNTTSNTSATPTEDWYLLEDNVPLVMWFEALKFHWFRFYAPTPCTDFGVSARPLSPYSTLADFDLSVSYTDPYPQTMKAGRNDFMSITEHDDYLTLKNLCPPQGVFYVGLWNWQGSGVFGSIVATSRSANWSKVPITQLGPLQMAYSLARDIVHLQCGEERFRTVYPPYAGAKPGDQWGAQWPFYAIPPTDQVEKVNHLWPLPKADLELYYLHALNWTAHADASVNKPRTLAFALALSKQDYQQVYVNTERLETCQLVWHGNLVNADGEPLTQTVNLTKASLPCDVAAFRRLLDRVQQIIDTMVTMTNYQDLQMAQTQLNFISFSDTWIGCREEMYKNVFLLQPETLNTEEPAPYCREAADTDAWRLDPCCTDRAKLDACCAETTHSYTRVTLRQLNLASIRSACATPQCAENVFSAVLTQTSSAECMDAFAQKAGPATIQALTDFYRQCRQNLVGDDLQGIACQSDGDCPNSTCNLQTFRCGYTDTDVLQCWIDTMDPAIARALFDLWLIPENVTRARLLVELETRFVSEPTCVGPTGLRFREAFKYVSNYDDCYDLCRDPSKDLDLQPHCFEMDPKYCPIPPVCSGWFLPYNWCWRQWDYNLAQPQSACQAAQRCNWLPCTSTLDPQCGAKCLNASLPVDVCIECTRTGGCVGLPGVAQSECRNRSLVGSCSVLCNNETTPCTTQASCEAAGTCTGMESVYAPLSIFEHYGNRTGLCFSPFVSDFLGGVYCGGSKAFDWPDGELVAPESRYGCVCSNERWSHPNCNLSTTATECAAKGFLWVNDDKTQSQCAASPMRCFVDGLVPALSPPGVYNTKALDDCTACAGEAYRTVNQWKAGVWTASEPVTRFWTTRQYQPINEWKPSIDYIAFGHEVSRALVARAALAYSTEALCRYQLELDALDTYTCDCSSNTGCGVQAVGRSGRPFAVDRVCPYLAASFDHPEVSVNISAAAFPPERFCQNLYLASYPASAFQGQLQNKLSSEIFITRATNAYALVRDRQTRQLMGQIMTHGINVTWSSRERLGATEAITLCIPIETDIPRDRAHVTAASGYLTDEGLFHRGRAEERTETNQICFGIDEPGVYFGTAIRDVKEESASNVVMFAIATVLYVILTSLVVGQCVRYLRYRMYKNSSIRLLKPLMLGSTLLFGVLRVVYMVYMAASTTLENTSGWIVVLFEFPNVLRFINLTGIIYIWLTIVRKYKAVSVDHKAPLPRPFWVGAATLLGIFIGCMVAFYSISETPPLPCLSAVLKDPQPRHTAVNLAFLIIMAVIAALVPIAYLATGSYFIHVTRRHPIVVRATTLVMATYVTMNLVTCALTLWSALTNGVVPILLFPILEIVPMLVLLHYVVPLHVRSADNVSLRASPKTAAAAPSRSQATKTPQSTTSSTRESTQTVNVENDSSVSRS